MKNLMINNFIEVNQHILLLLHRIRITKMLSITIEIKIKKKKINL